MATNKLKIRTGDTVQVITGKDRGKQGTVTKALPATRQLIVEGVNVVKKHQKPSGMTPGQIVEKELPIDISNVKLIDPASNQPTRVGFTVQDGKKQRLAKKTGKVIEAAA